MKKTVRSLVGILGCTILLTGCVQLPPVPDAMKESTYNNIGSKVNSNNHYTDIRKLTGDVKLSCELMYCTANIENKKRASDENCKPSRDRLENLTNQYKEFSEQQKTISDFIDLCPHTNTIDSPFK